MAHEAGFADAHVTDDDVFENVVEKIDHSKYSNIIYGQNWSTGVLGIVASRIIEKSYKPTIIITDFDKELLTGSVRSVSGFDVYDDAVLFHLYCLGLTPNYENS